MQPIVHTIVLIGAYANRKRFCFCEGMKEPVCCEAIPAF
jgi:hypothetical protein